MIAGPRRAHKIARVSAAGPLLAAVQDPHGFARGPRQLSLLEHGELRAQVEKLFEVATQPRQHRVGKAIPGLDEEGQPVAAAGRPVEDDLVLVADTREPENQRFDLLGVEVDPAEDHHVVGPPAKPVQAQVGAATGTALPTPHPREIVSAVADQRQSLAGERAYHQLALFAVGAEAARLRVHHLEEIVVLPDVDALAGLAVDPEPRPARLRHADDVERGHAELALDKMPQIVGPHLRAQDGHAERERSEVELLLARHFEDPQRIGRDAREDSGAQIAHHLELERGPAGPGRDDHGPDALGAIVKSEPAGEKAEGRGDLNDIARADPRRHVAPRHHFRPLLHVGPRVGIDHGVTRGARGHVDAHDPLGLDTGQAERIGVAQLVLGEERQAGPVGGSADVAGLYSGQAPPPGRVGQDVTEGPAQALERPPLQLLPRQRLRPRLPHGRRHDAGREASARNTRSGVIGSSVSRTPTASFTALATAAATGMIPASPSPLAPKGPASSIVSISSTTISGMSEAAMSAYSMNCGLTTRPSWIRSSSDKA